ncbi:MAG: hypothetical protein IJK04_10480 [Kiritimatiellae bacterium]|nr:hypothetical protein [Kiritimatiellia bacterium]
MIRSGANHDKWRVPAPSAVAMFVLAALFVAVRVLTAWFLRDEVNGDLAIVQLMARDMVADFRIPAFFYGQAYMGALEPVANALFHLLFGRTDFGTELGTVLFSVLMAWSVTRMARRMGGDWAAFAALALCVIGPLPFAHYAVSPRGGYGVLLFTTAGLLDIGGALIGEERREGRCRKAPAFFVGLLAGIGFWCNQLVFPAALAVALGVVFMAPRLLARARLWLGGILGFALGSAPFWIWNAHNGWESFQMSGSMVFDRVIAARNLLLLVRERLPMLFGVNPPYASGTAAALVVAAATLLPLLALRLYAPLPRRIHPDERQPPPDAKAQQALCWIYLAVFTGCFICSHFAVFPTPRYLLPAVPVLAALSGAACTSTRFRSANALAIALLFILLFLQVPHLRTLAARGRDDADRKAGYREAAAFLENKGTDVAFCSFRHNSLNLRCNRKVAFTDSDLERVPSFRRRAELADSPAIVEDFHGFARWAVASGGSLCATNVGGLRIATDIVPPPYAVADIPLGNGCISVNGQPVGDVLADRTFVTAWELTDNRSEIEIDLGEPRAICGVRCLVSGFGLDDKLRVFGRGNSETPYRPLAPAVPNVACRWSGPRLYPDPWCQVMESRFSQTDVGSVKIVLDNAIADGTIRKIREVQVLAPASGQSLSSPAEWHAAVDNLLDILRRQGVNRLYASRWIANAVSEKTKGAIWTNHDQNLHPKASGAPRPPTRPEPVELDGFTALLVSPSGAPAMRIALEKSWIKMREVKAGALGILFITESIQIFPQGLGDPIGFIFDPDCPTFFPSADWEELVLEEPPNVPNLVLPNYPPTVPWLRHSLEFHPDDNEAVPLRQAIDLLTEPMLGGEARFADIHVWRGMRVLDYGVRALPGGFIRLRHYWSSPRWALPDGRSCRVFVHFIGPGGYRFQDDFALDIPPERPDTTGDENSRPLSILPDCVLNGSVPYSRYPINAEVLWHVDRRVAIPADAPPGIYEMHLGLLDANYFSKRIPVETRLPHRRRAIIVNPVFAVNSSNDKEPSP